MDTGSCATMMTSAFSHALITPSGSQDAYTLVTARFRFKQALSLPGEG